MKGSLIIIGFFVLGIVCGIMHWLPDLNAYGNMSFMTLCALLFCVGVTVGNNTALLKSFRQLDPRFMLLPLMTITGTLLLRQWLRWVCRAAVSPIVWPWAQALVITHCQASSSPSIVVLSWELSPCWPISSVRFSHCSVHRSW